MVYLDRINIHVLIKLLFSRSISNVVVLEPIGAIYGVICKVLAIRNIHIREANFFAGELRFPDGESVMLKAQTLAGSLSFESAELVLSSEPELKKYNDIYGRNSIKLYLSKQFYYEISYWTTRVMVSQLLSENKKLVIWLRKPYKFDIELVSKYFPDVNIYCYSVWGWQYIDMFILLMRDIARDVRARLRNINEGDVFKSSTDKSVFSLQEDDIHTDKKTRGQPHWLDFSNNNDFKLWVLKVLGEKVCYVKDTEKLRKKGVEVLPISALVRSLKIQKKNIHITGIRKLRYKSYLSFFKSNSYSGKYFLLRIADLQRQAELIGSLALSINAKVFLIRETFVTYSDAMMLVAPRIGVTTIAYQYSNINVIAPIMMSTADKYLVFSDLYKKVFDINKIAPMKFVVTGYLYDGISKYVKASALSYRTELLSLGAKFVVCYFDEAVQHDRWGLVSKKSHLKELHALANKVIDDSTFAVVVKSQFIFNSPSQMYPNDPLIQKAKRTGRFFELKEGKHRNIIYPTEAALISDLCISHKFGATAGIEAAIAGIKTVLLDPYKTKTLFDEIYSDSDVVYDDMEMLIDAIDTYRNDPVNNKLGEWGKIIHQFDPYRDGKAVIRFNREINAALA